MLLIKMGSSTASMLSPRFSMMTVSPASTAAVTLVIQLLLPSCSTTTLLSSAAHLASSCFLIHLMPWSCGSMISGHLSALLMIAPFSTEIRSAGRPSFCQLATLASSVRTFNGSIPSVSGISLLIRSGSHVFFQSISLKLAPNAPTYETKAALNKTLPLMVTSCLFILSISLLHLTFSLLRPVVNLSARSNLSWQAFASSSTAFLASVASKKLLCSLFSFSSMPCMTATTPASCSSAAALTALASSRLAIKGFTFL
mmetsp:Transcript_14429/g.26652  ORF Transcript_14429/g.26652 Transcript_14429/m.26652 type:complete len:256 (+) Transcript_14429:149-916(+)